MAQVTRSHSYLQQNYNIPTIPPSGSKFKGLKKIVARCIAYFTNAQNEFNANVVRTLNSFQIQLEKTGNRLDIHERKIFDISETLKHLQSRQIDLYNLHSQLNVVLVRFEKMQGHHGAIIASYKDKINNATRLINETQSQIKNITLQFDSVNKDILGIDNRQNDLTEILNNSFKNIDNRQSDLAKKTNKTFIDLNNRQDDLTKKTNGTFEKLNNRQDNLTKKSTKSFEKLNDRQNDLTHKLNDSLYKLNNRQDDLTKKSNETFEKLNNRQDDLTKKSNETFEKLNNRQDDLTEKSNETFEKLNNRQDDLTEKSNSIFEKLSNRQDDLAGIFKKYNNHQNEIDKTLKSSSSDFKTNINAISDRLTLSEQGFTELNALLNVFSKQTSLLSSSLNTALTDFSSVNDKTKLKSSLLELNSLWNDIDYASYENTCRGTDKLITERLSYYLKWFENIKTTKQTYVLDLGCGRGEFVELLNNNKIHARGVDLNKFSVQHAKSKKINVKQADIFEELKRFKPKTLPAISAFHLVEHLTFTELQSLLQLAATRLKPGGILLIETPNILNIQVAASDFYKDPTHIRPVHPSTLSHWLKHSGFSKIKIEFLHPFPKDEQLKISKTAKIAGENFNKLNNLIYGARDCAIIAVK
ncbi:methyltransferase domain-containing protein [bacterium]|nr:methyltransferase domain-containing protein [bacterium]